MMSMTLGEFASYFINGVLKLQCFPVIVLYFAIVALSPLWIRNVRPFGFRKVLVVYNFACSLLSLYSVVFIIAALAKNWPHSLFDTSKNDPLLRHALWVYYMTKYIELLDTVFMILRHRQRQMTFLHLYHHPTILMLSEYALTNRCWLAVGFHAAMNGIVHVFLYFYYGQSALNPGQRPGWKKQLTQLQLIQFMVGLCHMIVGWLYHGFCSYSIWYELTMIWLFSNFYYQAYLKESGSVKKIE